MTNGSRSSVDSGRLPGIAAPAREVEELVAGLGHLQAVLLEDVLPIPEHGGLGAEGDAERGSGRAGHGRGHHDVAERLTWRQIRRFWEVEAARRAEDVERLAALLVGR